MTERQNQGALGARDREAMSPKSATAEILAVKRGFEREREQAARSLEEVQRRLAETEARGEEKVRVADARRQSAAERIDAEMRRLQAESDATIEAALAKVEADTLARMEQEAGRRLAEQEERLHADAEERVRVAAETAQTETERRLRDEIYREAEVEARAAAADWVRGQTHALLQEQVRDAERRISQARREAREEAERRLAEREQEVAASVALEPPARDEPAPAEPEASPEAAGPSGLFVRARLRRAAQALRSKWEARTAERDQEKRSEEAAERGARSKPVSGAGSRPGSPSIDLNQATFEQLRELGMSVTQATRVIAYRDREGGFESPEELAAVPGISKRFASQIKDQLTA